MVVTVYSAPATEPLSIAEVMAHCYINAGNLEPAPGAITAALSAPAAPGNVDNGVHRYLATFVTADGETQGGTVSAALTVVDKTVNGQVALTAIPLGGALVTARKLYRTTAGGSTYLLLATLSNNTATTYTDNTADAGLGAGAPTTNTTADPNLRRLITDARKAAEQELHRYLITQTLDAHLDRFPRHDGRRVHADGCCDCVELLLPPLQSVTSITYVDEDGATQTLPTDQYQVDAVSEPARIVPAYNVTWPATRKQPNAVIVRFVAGYGTAAEVPAPIKSWMLMHIKTLYVNRDFGFEKGANGEVIVPPSFIDGLLDGERVYGRMFA